MQDSGYQWYAVLWFSFFLLNLILTWRRGQTVGLTATFLLVFLANNWLASALQALPWAWTGSAYLSELGLQQSLAGMLGLTAGLILVSPRLLRRHATSHSSPPVPADINSTLDKGFILSMTVGLMATFVSIFLPDLGRSALTATFLGVLQQFLLLAMCLLAYKMLLARSIVGWLVVFGAAIIFPMFGLIATGIISIGVTTSVVLVLFFLSCRGIDKRTVALLVVTAYVGLSLFIPYLYSREGVRADVRDGAPLEQRVNSASVILENLKPFSPTDPDHISLISARMDNNAIIGLAVLNLRGHVVPYSLGRTFLTIPAAMIPRALWPSKPILAGGSDFATYYTGVSYAEGTSAGIGPVLEGYVNFGSAGVFVLFLLYGMIIPIFDAQSRTALTQGNIRRFSLWFLTGFYLVNPSELLATVVAAMVSTFLVLQGVFWAIDVITRQQKA